MILQQSFMDILLTDAAAKAVCWTLVHSLWQGLVAALVAGAVILLTRKSAAVLRYNLLTADLVLFLLASVGTFWYEWHVGGGAAGEPADIVVVDGVRDAAGGMGIHVRYAVAAPSLPERVGIFLNEHAVVVVMVWMACLSIQLVRMTGGLYRMHRLRHERVFWAADCWQQRMSMQMARMGIEKKVVLLQSGSVKMPVTFGFLKPCILVPLGMLANLPAEQVETILLHELAHIRRGDYLANLLLHIGEAVFLFNPGVRWVAWLIREEREACCDDLVLAGVKDRNSYFEALIAFGDYAIGKRSMALTLGSGGSDLLWRIRRMLNQENKKLHLMEKTILSFGLMAVLAIGLVSMKGTGGAVMGRGAAGMRGTVVVRGAGRVVDILPASAVSGSKKSRMAMTAALPEVDTVPTVKGKNLGRATKALMAVPDTAEASIMLDSMTAITTYAGPGAITIQVTATHLNARAASTMAAAVMKVAGESATAETHAPVTTMTTIKVENDTRITPVTTVKLVAGAPSAPMTTISAPKADLIAPETEIAASKVPAAPSVEIGAYMKPIIADLKARGIIQTENPLTFILNVHGLEVNGVQQPAEIYQVFKEKYINNFTNSYHYSLQESSTYSSVGLTNE